VLAALPAAVPIIAANLNRRPIVGTRPEMDVPMLVETLRQNGEHRTSELFTATIPRLAVELEDGKSAVDRADCGTFHANVRWFRARSFQGRCPDGPG
jgi:hypothetical protein